MVTLSPAYSITIKVGEKLFAGHVDNSLAIVPQYEPILRKSLGGRFDLDFVSVDLDMRISGLTYERTTGEAATHNDFADLRAACSSPVSVAFVYGAIVPGNIVLTGNAKLSEYQETAGSGKISGQWSCRLRSVRGSVQEEVIPGPPQDFSYGLMYNHYVATDIRNVASAGWHVTTEAEHDTLGIFLGGDSVAGGKLKETGIVFWNNPNIGATNETGFNGRAGGYRANRDGLFVGMKEFLYLWNTGNMGTTTGRSRLLYSGSASLLNNGSGNPKGLGFSLRLTKDSTLLTDGQTGTYNGNDGKVYRTICIGTQEILADNLAETKFRTGESIPEVTDNAAWAALTSAGMCAYNNDWSNV